MSQAVLFFHLCMLFQLKHFVADYLFHGKYMLGKFKEDWSFFLPLLSHVAVHGAMTLIVCLIFAPSLWWLAFVDMTVHFLMDRIKASPHYMGRWKSLTGEQYMEALRQVDSLPKYRLVFCPDHPGWSAMDKLRSNRNFWYSLGFDQMVHHLTDLFIVYMIVV